MTRLWQSLALVLVLSGTTAHAQATVDDVEGVWKRVSTEGSARYLQLTVADDVLAGAMINPPKGINCEIALRLAAGRVLGKATWSEPHAGGEWTEETAWEFTIEGTDMRGRSEWIDWEEGKVYDRGWENHHLVKLPRIGLVTEGEAEEAFGDPVETTTLTGGWMALGGPWALTTAGDKIVLMPIGHHEGVSINLTNDRGTLKGTAALQDGNTSDVELAFDPEEGKLTGRCSWVSAPELADKAVIGWGPLEFARVKRMDEGTGAPELAAAPTSSLGPIFGVWKRDDGFFLRIRDEGGEVTGILCEKNGQPTCRVLFEEKKGIWVGTANWEGLETTWELGVDEEGVLSGRCEWVDLHDGNVIARGWASRTFRKLRRVQ